MNKPHIKRSSVLALFLGVAIFADIVPWPGLGDGVIHRVTQELFPKREPAEKVFNSREPSIFPEHTPQNSLFSSPSNDG